MSKSSRNILARNKAAAKFVGVHARAVEWFYLQEKGQIAELNQKQLLGLLAEVQKTKDIDSILALECTLLGQELHYFANSSEMKGSLNTAIKEINVATGVVVKARNPAVYETVDEAHLLPKNRIDDLPRDEARQFFKSHPTRLRNLQKA